jgi:hypothetical protein
MPVVHRVVYTVCITCCMYMQFVINQTKYYAVLCTAHARVLHDHYSLHVPQVADHAMLAVAAWHECTVSSAIQLADLYRSASRCLKNSTLVCVSLVQRAGVLVNDSLYH